MSPLRRIGKNALEIASRKDIDAIDPLLNESAQAQAGSLISRTCQFPDQVFVVFTGTKLRLDRLDPLLQDRDGLKGRGLLILHLPHLREQSLRRRVVRFRVLHTNNAHGRFDTGLQFAIWTEASEESEANAFAAELLMPDFLFTPRLKRQAPSFRNLDQLAEHF